MSTILQPPGLGEHTRRVPAIAANLLPAEIVDARRSRKVRRAVIAGVAAVAVLLAGWYVLASYQTSAAADDLANAQTESQVLVREQHQYADLVNTKAQLQAIDGQLATVFAGDLTWPSLLDTVQAAAPAGVSVTSVSGTSGAAKSTTTGATTRPGMGPNGLPANPDAVGTVTITGQAPDKPSIAAYVDRLARVPQLADPWVASVNASGQYRFTVQFDVVKSALGSRYVPTSGK